YSLGRGAVGIRVLEGVGDCCLESQRGPVLGGGVPCIGSAAAACRLEEGGVEPGLDLVLGLAVAVGVLRAGKPRGAAVVAAYRGDRRESAQGLGDHRPDDQLVGARE